MRRATLFAALLVFLCAARGSAQGLKWFYCYAPNAQTGIVHVSDIQSIGPVAERAGYGNEFVEYLKAEGKLSSGGQAYCVMRATEREIELGQRELSAVCNECGTANKVERVVWPRGGRTIRHVLAGEGNTTPPADAATTEDAEDVDTSEGIGVFMMVRLDETDAVYTANEDNAQFLTRFKADQKGGEWSWILTNDRCPGWVAVAYASKDNTRQYFAERGGADEIEAGHKGLAAARAYVQGEVGIWETGLLYVFKNNYQAPGADFSRGAIEGVKKELEKRLVDPCAPVRRVKGIGGVRG